MTYQHHPTGLTDERWAILEPLIPTPKPGGRPRRAELRAAVSRRLRARLRRMALGLSLVALLAACTGPAPPTPPGDPPRTVLQATPTAAQPPVASPAPPATPVAPRTTLRPEALATPLPVPAGWQRLGLAGQDLRAISADPANPALVYAGGVALWKSADGGRVWQRLREVRSLRDLVVSGAELLVAASDGCARGTAATAWRSTDRGATWQELGPNLMSLAARPDGSALYAAGCPGVLRSDDGGLQWRTIARQENAEGVAIALSPAQPDVLWAAFVSEGGSVYLQRSSDGGRSWRSSELPGEVWAPVRLALHPRQPDTLYLAGRSGALRTTDGGHTWTRLERGLEAARRVEGSITFYDFTAALATPDLLLLGTASAGVYVSRDAGASFTRLPDDLPPTRAVALHRSEPLAALAATADGVYRSRLP